MSFSLPKHIIDSMTDVFDIERDGNVICSAHGFFCGSNYPSTIQLVENTDIQEEDWLIHALTGNRYFAAKVRPISMQGEIHDWMVTYQSETEWKRSQETNPSTNIHIGTISGPSIIGSQKNAAINIGNTVEDIAKLIATKPSEDITELCELVAELKKIEQSDHGIEKGKLSKFSDLLQKHSDVLIALGGWAVKLLTGNQG